MSKAKLLQAMRNNPRDWRIEDVLAIAKSFSVVVCNHGGSHHVFKYPGVSMDVCVPAHRPIKPVYIRQFVAFVDKVLELRHAQ
jgi:hypothetical protein